MRFCLCGLLLMTLLSSPLRADETCTWVEAKPATLKPGKGTIDLSYKYDKAWFKCAKKQGELRVKFLYTSGKVQKDGKEQKLTSSKGRVSVFRSDLCKKDFATERVLVKLVGTGPFERLNATLEPVDFFCPKCQYKAYDTTLGAVTMSEAVRSSAGARALTVSASVNKAWHKCARKQGGNLELRVYTGASEAEVKSSEKPAVVLKQLSKKPKFKKLIPQKKICKGKPAYVAVELFGSKEFAAVNGGGRSVKSLGCK